MPTDLRSITQFDDLIAYLRDELDWPIGEHGLEELTFEYDADELGLKNEEAAKLKDGTIRQLRPLPGGQPFGIFFVEFGHARLPVVVLRRILNALVLKQRNSANPADRQRWDAADLLFISAFGEDEEREIAFAHFHKEPNTTEIPVLRVLGWDGSDTSLKTQYVAQILKDRLHWPESPNDHEAWRKQWRGAFHHRIGHVIRTANDLADALAVFARKIRTAAITIMTHESEARGQLRKLHKAFKASLISDLSEEDFADTYAQTVTYGLLTAAISRTEMTEGRTGTALTQENITAMVPVTNPFLKEMLQEFLRVGGRSAGMDFDELGINEIVELLRGDETDLPAILRDFGNRRPGEDPVIHFYETFLQTYNKQLRVQRGVFYTPKPVVSYIVRSVHELLQSEFGLEDGLASTITWDEMLERNCDLQLPPKTDEPGCQETISPDEFFIQVLDPATGTATFLVEVIDVIYKHLKEKWEEFGLAAMPRIPNPPSNSHPPQTLEDYWNHYVLLCLLPRVHGYELMMAPYAIAHMKVGLKLAETGYRFGTEERARIYLTNALEPWQKQLPLIGFDALAHEAAAVNEIKRHKRFTIVVGNPPYAGISSNMTEYAQRIVDAYRIVDGTALNEKKLWLQDDYVKFIRKAQTIIESALVGVLGYITNHGYLNNPTFRGMRRSFMRTFPRLRVLDLHGNANKKEQSPDGSEDKNVFDIRQGVAICLATRNGDSARVEHAELWGTREAKYSRITKQAINNTTFSTLTPDSPYYFFEPQNIDTRAEYECGWKINEAMPINCAGFITARDHFVVDFEKDALLSRIDAFANLTLSDAEIRATYFSGCGSAKYPDGDTRGWKVPEARRLVARDKNWRERVRACLYRPFDERQVYWANWMVDWPRPDLTRHLDLPNNIAFITTRITKDAFSLLPTRTPPGHKSVGAYDVNYVFPLWAAPEHASLFEKSAAISPNFAPRFLEEIASSLGLKVDASSGLPAGLTPEDIFHYAYAVFHSPSYRSRYAEFLKIDFPRLPLTGNLALFRELSRLGGELVALHLLEAPILDTPRTEFIDNNRQVTKVGWTLDNGGTVWIDDKGTKGKFTPGTSGFRPVPEEVWNFHIGGYQVCEKWLKDRGPKKGQPGRTLTDDDIAHYHKIVIALTETIRLMAEIDEVIEAHGGWPGAFAAQPKKK